MKNMAQFQRHFINKKELPESMRWILARYPSYRKHNVSLWTIQDDEIQQTVSSYWDGGSRDIWTHLGTDRQPKLICYPPWPNNPSVDITVRKGEYLVQSGTFCGKQATLLIIAVLGAPCVHTAGQCDRLVCDKEQREV